MDNIVANAFLLALIVFPVILLCILWFNMPPSLLGSKTKIGEKKYQSTLRKRTLRTIIRAETKYHFELSRQKGDDREEEFQTGERAFDTYFYIISDDPHFHQLLASNKQLRKTALAFKSIGTEFGCRAIFQGLYHQAGRIWVNLQTSSNISEENIERIGHRTAELLYQFDDQLAQHTTESAAPVMLRDPFIWVTKIFQAGCFSLAIATAFMLYDNGYRPDSFNVDRVKLFFYSALLTAVCTVPIYVLTHLIFRRSSRWRRMVVFLVFFVGIGLFMACVNGVNWYNRLDDSTAMTYSTTVVHKRIHTYKGREKHHYIYVPDWDETGRIRWDVGSRRAYDEIEVGQSITIVGHQGRLGIRWGEHVD